MTGDELVAYYKAIKRGDPVPSYAINDVSGSNKVNRANALLKKAGLITYNRSTRFWEAT